MVARSSRHVGILEQFYHSHVVYQMAAAAEAGGHHVTLYVSKRVDEKVGQFGPLDAEVVIRDDDEPLDTYLSRVEPSTAELDLLIINTVARLKRHTSPVEPYRSFLEFSPSCPVVYSIYGVNTWLSDQPVTGGHAKRNTFRRRFSSDGLIVQYSPWKTYADEHLDPPVPVLEYPYPIHEPEPVDSSGSDGPLEVIIPGALYRRDYDLVFRAFAAAWDTGVPVRMTVLARPKESYCESVMRLLTAAKERGRPVDIRTGFLPRDEYEAALRDADVILVPLKEEVHQRGFTEQMGYTTNSGVIFDAIRVGQPLILPSFFPLGWELADHGVLTYAGIDGLQGVLTRVAGNRDLLAGLGERARQNAATFLLERQAERFDGLLAGLG